VLSEGLLADCVFSRIADVEPRASLMSACAGIWLVFVFLDFQTEERNCGPLD
jgi:hypothetical protein